MVGTIATYAAAALGGAAMTWAIMTRNMTRNIPPPRPDPPRRPGPRRALAQWIRSRWTGDDLDARRLRTAADMLEEDAHENP